MIDRKAFLVSLALIVLMVVAAIWRLSLSPSWWHYTFIGPNDAEFIQSARRLFIVPAMATIVIALMAWRKWRAGAAVEAIRAWSKVHSFGLIAISVICALQRAYIIALSLGLTRSWDRTAVVKSMFVVMALLVIVLGNRVPKLPWLQPRLGPLRNLSPERGARFLRFQGWLNVLFGLAILAVVATVHPPAAMIHAMLLVIALWGLATFGRMLQLWWEQRRDGGGSPPGCTGAASL